MRFLTGLGLGGVLPNITALISEYAPPRAVCGGDVPGHPARRRAGVLADVTVRRGRWPPVLLQMQLGLVSYFAAFSTLLAAAAVATLGIRRHQLAV